MSKEGVMFGDAITARKILMKRMEISMQKSRIASVHNKDVESRDQTLMSPGCAAMPKDSLTLNTSYQALTRIHLDSWLKSLPRWMNETISTAGSDALQNLTYNYSKINVTSTNRDYSSISTSQDRTNLRNKITTSTLVSRLCSEQEKMDVDRTIEECAIGVSSEPAISVANGETNLCNEYEQQMVQEPVVAHKPPKKEVEFKRWGLILTIRGSLFIVDYSTRSIKRSRDISSCERVDAHTMYCSDGTVYRLLGSPNFIDKVPIFVQDKFKSGFPPNWQSIMIKWLQFLKQGKPSDFDWTDSDKTMETLKDCFVKINPLKITHECYDKLRTLEKWTPMLVKPSRLIIKGFLSSSQNTHTTAALKNVQDDKIECEDGAEYKLIGPFIDSCKNIPNEIQKYLQKGMPSKWKEMVAKWEALEMTSSENEKHEVPTDMKLKPLEETTLQRSRRGRIRIPPLKFWLGEKMVRNYDSTMVLICGEDDVQKQLARKNEETGQFQHVLKEKQGDQLKRKNKKIDKTGLSENLGKEKQGDQLKRKNKKIDKTGLSENLGKEKQGELKRKNKIDKTGPLQHAIEEKRSDQLRKSKRNKQSVTAKKRKQDKGKSRRNELPEYEKDEESHTSGKVDNWLAKINNGEEDILPGGYEENSNSVDYDEHFKNLLANKSAVTSCTQSPIHTYMTREETPVSSFIQSSPSRPSFSSKWISQYIQREVDIQKKRKPVEHIDNIQKKGKYEQQTGKYINLQYEEIVDRWFSDSDLSSSS